MKRTFFLVVWATLLGLLAAACGSGVGAGGAAVEYAGQSLPRSEVNEFAAWFNALGPDFDTEADLPPVTPESVAQGIQFFALSAAVEDAMGDEISDTNRAEAERWAEDQFKGLPKDSLLFERVQAYWASRLAIPDEDIRTRFDEVVAQQPPPESQVCAAHILIGIDVESPDFAGAEAQALDLLEQIEGGADFASLAQQFSTDLGSGAQGGELGCAPQGAYVPEFDAAVWEGQEGDIIGPVETQFGFHIILHGGFVEGEGFNFEAEAEGIRESLFQERLGDAIIGANVQVDPRYGTWNSDEGSLALPEGAETEGDDVIIPIGE